MLFRSSCQPGAVHSQKPQEVADTPKLRNDALMKSRIEYAQVAPEAVEAMRALENYVSACSIEPKLLELIKIHASQINGCAYCLDMHTKDARAQRRNRATDLCTQLLA